jgi:hypothetical protein
MPGRLPFARTRASAPRGRATLLCALCVLPVLACASGATPTPGEEATDEPAVAAEPPVSASDNPSTGKSYSRPRYAPPEETPGVPTDAELQAAHAVVGEILIDNQNIFNPESDPKDDNWLFRLANHLHGRTRPGVIRDQLLFSSGQPYDPRLVAESERILRADSYFYDAWIRKVRYHDGKVDLRVTTRDVWTLNPGFNYSRSGGTNSTGAALEDISLFGTGTDAAVNYSNNIDRSGTAFSISNQHSFGTWISAGVTYGTYSDGYLRAFSAQSPFYALNTPWAAGVYGLNGLQTDSLWDRAAIIDQFQDLHEGAQIYGGWSQGLQNGWVRRWSIGLTYDEHLFSPVSTWTGVTDIPQDRRFVYPWVQFDLIQDDFLKLWNHDQIARTEDFYLGTAASARVGWADTAYGSNQNALIFQSNASSGFRQGGSTLLLFGDFSGRVTDGELRNGVMDASVRYYVEQSKNWLFFSTLLGTKGWRLDLDDQILLGGDSGLRGYPLRYQDGTARALWTVEQRYFTDWYLFRLIRVGGAIFFDAGRVWGTGPLAVPNLGLLKDAGFGLRFGNARSGLGNVVHCDIAFPFNGDTSVKRVQFLVQTEHSF